MWLCFAPARVSRQPWCRGAVERRASAGESDRMRPPTGRSSFCLAGITTTLRCHLREENVRHDKHTDRDYLLSIIHLPLHFQWKALRKKALATYIRHKPFYPNTSYQHRFVSLRDGIYIAEETNSLQTSFLPLLVQHCVD